MSDPQRRRRVSGRDRQGRAQAVAEAVSDDAKTAQKQADAKKAVVRRQALLVVCCDTGAQATALLNGLKVKCQLRGGGDLFVDGRHLADALGIKLPATEYKLRRQETVKNAVTKTRVGALNGKGK